MEADADEVPVVDEGRAVDVAADVELDREPESRPLADVGPGPRESRVELPQRRGGIGVGDQHAITKGRQQVPAVVHVVVHDEAEPRRRRREALVEPFHESHRGRLAVGEFEHDFAPAAPRHAADVSPGGLRRLAVRRRAAGLVAEVARRAAVAERGQNFAVVVGAVHLALRSPVWVEHLVEGVAAAVAAARRCKGGAGQGERDAHEEARAGAHRPGGS